VEWQRKTRSLLFIDGSFQYAKWGGEPSEFSSAFDPAHTVRLICPTKALAAHGYRFSYVLLPEAMHQECTHIYANIYGSASVDSLAFARIVPAALQSRDIIMPLMLTVATRHRSLRSQGKISSAWEPSSGYFIFEKILVPLPEGTILMDGSFFEQKRYPEYRRINLLSPSLHLLG